jgi:hypothetical protein
MRTYNQTSVEMEQKIITLYKNGKSSVMISKELDTSPTTVLKIVRRHGFPTRTAKQTSKRYTFNENFFEEIDTEEKAYWIGFILADGCLSRGKDITIALKESDKLHLDKFIYSINGNNKYHIRKNNGGYNHCTAAFLSIRSEKMYNDLIKHGLEERKSLTATLPTGIPKNLYRHFWRGLVDGDGHICIINTKNKGYRYTSIEIGLCGTKDVMIGFENYTKNYINTKAKTRTNKMIWRFSVGGKNALQLCSLLYDNSMIYLDRKLKIYEQYKQINIDNS